MTKDDVLIFINEKIISAEREVKYLEAVVSLGEIPEATIQYLNEEKERLEAFRDVYGRIYAQC
ncbi:MAG: hypothetical protein N0C84_01040 [Candidatus Thiodiazotropha taylori]|uniref:Uncharacterized protein n=1 Tax=Candidatus Thiodiazotropha taylori TaxID=2792791 RepID=A0A9E4KAC3_9GAMM|nr:hypothetical protein [Candidatus Thiodiazotropha taylori]MCW4255031.1 hypothetical protein [Candidatus Thiodiazotropha taylori]